MAEQWTSCRYQIVTVALRVTSFEIILRSRGSEIRLTRILPGSRSRCKHSAACFARDAAVRGRTRTVRNEQLRSRDKAMYSSRSHILSTIIKSSITGALQLQLCLKTALCGGNGKGCEINIAILHFRKRPWTGLRSVPILFHFTVLLHAFTNFESFAIERISKRANLH